MRYVHTVEYYSAFKRKAVLTHATKWVNLEDIILSEISQSQKDKYSMILLYELSRVVRFIKTGARKVVVRSWGEGRWGVPVNGCSGSVWKDVKVLESDCDVGCTMM